MAFGRAELLWTEARADEVAAVRTVDVVLSPPPPRSPPYVPRYS